MKKKSVSYVFIALLTILIIGNSTVFAQETIGSKDWDFNLAPFYLWGVSIDGDMTSGTKTVPVEVPFSDLFDNLEAAFIVHFEVMHKNTWGFLVDINYLDVANDVSLPAPINLKPNVDFDAGLGEFSGLYRIKNGDYAYDFIGGFRYVELKNKVSAAAGPTLANDSVTWVDPIAGFRWMWGFADQWTLVTRGDIGGFGIGSDLSLQGLALIDWQPFKYVSFLAGYRALYQDYEDGSGADLFRFKATMHGPLIGINFRW